MAAQTGRAAPTKTTISLTPAPTLTADPTRLLARSRRDPREADPDRAVVAVLLVTLGGSKDPTASLGQAP